jgi:hypothetical protein
MSDYQKMDPAVKELWCEALESGLYKQGRGALKTLKGGYCCLGVLCDITGNGYFAQGKADGLAYGIPTLKYTDDEAHAAIGFMLPLELQNEFGITADAMNTLAVLNDHARRRFPTIAKWIRENL